MKKIISLKGVSFSYSENLPPTLKNIDLDVCEGEFLGIIGPTGSGKTTLLNIMSGVIPHYFNKGVLQGEVLVNEIPTRDLSLAKITEEIGLVMQDPEAQLFNLLVKDELVWGLENRGYSREAMAKTLVRVSEELLLNEFLERVTFDLSGGEKQKIAIGAIYMIGPKLIVLDNPTSQLDPVGSSIVIQTIKNLVTRGGHTVVMVEDKLGELVRTATRLVLINQGQIVLNATPREFCSQKESLESAGIRTYELAELAFELRKEGIALPQIPINLEEGVEIFQTLLHIRKR
jgi:energy-coupling factor transporter ATP-binding protein EcfA2